MTRTHPSVFINKSLSSIKDGCCLVDKKHNLNIVLYDALNTNFERRNWSLAHEVGHIYMGHTKDEKIEEIEAHYFASQLFMPEFTLFMIEKTYGSFDAYDLMEIFGVSYQAAQKRVNSFRRMKIIDGGKSHVLIWEQQKPKIDLYFQCKKNGDEFRYALEMQNIYNEEMRELYYMYAY